MSDPAQAAERAKIDPELKELIEGLDFPVPDEHDAARAALDLRDMTDNFFVRKTHPDVKESDVSYRARDGHSLRLHVFEPRVASGAPKPLVVLFHSGGTCIGRPEELAYAGHALVTGLNAVVIAPQYRLAPEHPFPQAAHDAWDAVRHIAAHAATFAASPAAGFVVGGVSAGATMAANISHLAVDEGLAPPLTGVWLGCGQNLQPEAVTEAYRARYLSRTQPECATAPILPIKTLRVFNKAAAIDPHSHLASNLLWPSGHAGLPRTYVQVAGMDVCRDENILYYEALREAQTEVRMDIYKGMPHIFWQPFARLKQTDRWREDFIGNFGWLLGQSAA